MKNIPYEKFKHGQRVTCEIRGLKITDAKISIDSDGTAYICQNIANGVRAEDKLGYRMGWTINRAEYYKDGDNSITNLQLFPRTIDDLEEGDVVVDTDGCEQKVLGICGNVYFLSEENEFTKVDEYYYTTQELEDNGYTLKQEECEQEYSLKNSDVKINSKEDKITYNGKTYILSK